MHKLILVITSLSLVSCGHIFTKSDTFTNSSPASAMIYTAGSAKLKSPFKWRILATGKPEEHTSLIIHSVTVNTTTSKRKNIYPKNQLPPDATFLPYAKTPEISYAVTQFPGLLEIDPEKDGTSTMTVDLTVRTKSSSKRETLTFTLVRKNEKKTEFLFFPSEIVKSFGPEDPREWKLNYNVW